MSGDFQAQHDDLARKMLRVPLKSREDLKNWLLGYLGVDLADCVVSRYADKTPLDMVWDIYQLCMDEHNLYPKDLRYIAGRSSQKTLSLAALQILLPLHFKRSVVHFGGTVKQAKRAYTYFRSFVTRPYIREYLVSEPTQNETVLMIDGEKITVEILPISRMSVQGAHAPIVSLDELASLAPDKVAAYEDVSGVPTYTKDGKPWFKFGISSRQGAYTVIESEYSQAEKKGIAFHFWTVLENTKRCPDEISGTEPLSYYVNIQDNEAVLEEQYQLLSPAEQSKFEKVNAYNKCFTCPLKVVCAGDLKKQKSQCKTLRPVQSVIKEFMGADYSWFLSQLMSLTPSLEGLVFSKFKREKFEKTPDEIYEIFMGTKPLQPVSKEALIQLMLQKGVKAYAGLDYGYTDPTVLVICYEDSIGTVYVMKVFAETNLDPDQLIQKIKELHSIYKFTVIYPDTAQPALNALLRKQKFVKVIDDFDKKGQIQNGIALIRQKLSPTVGDTKLMGIKGECDFLVDEFQKYHYLMNAAGKIIEEPADEFNHAIDALRYAAINMWSRGGALVLPSSDLPNNQQTTISPTASNDPARWVQDKIKSLATAQTQDDNKDKNSPKKGIIWKI